MYTLLKEKTDKSLIYRLFYLSCCARKRNTINEVIDFYYSAETQKGIQGTAYGLYHAVTGYFQNRRIFSNETSKMKNIVLHGTAFQYQQKAFNLLVKHN